MGVLKCNAYINLSQHSAALQANITSGKCQRQGYAMLALPRPQKTLSWAVGKRFIQISLGDTDICANWWVFGGWCHCCLICAH